MRHLMFIRVMAVTVSVIAALGIAARASATCNVSSCSAITCSSDAVLQNDIDCTNVPTGGITLTSGADLNMNGHNITCTSNCPPRAITVGTNLSIINNSSGTESTISGGFGTALIDCAGKSGSRVTGLHLESTVTGTTDTVAVKDCAKVDGNVIIGSGSNTTAYGIETGGVANTDWIKDNYIDKWRYNISVSGSHDILVAGNVITIRDIAGTGGEVGINQDVGSTGIISIENNTFFGGVSTSDIMTIGGTTGTVGGNFCDPASAACAYCSLCDAAVAPITRPPDF